VLPIQRRSPVKVVLAMSRRSGAMQPQLPFAQMPQFPMPFMYPMPQAQFAQQAPPNPESDEDDAPTTQIQDQRLLRIDQQRLAAQKVSNRLSGLDIGPLSRKSWKPLVYHCKKGSSCMQNCFVVWQTTRQTVSLDGESLFAMS